MLPSLSALSLRGSGGRGEIDVSVKGDGILNPDLAKRVTKYVWPSTRLEFELGVEGNRVTLRLYRLVSGERGERTHTRISRAFASKLVEYGNRSVLKNTQDDSYDKRLMPVRYKQASSPLNFTGFTPYIYIEGPITPNPLMTINDPQSSEDEDVFDEKDPGNQMQLQVAKAGMNEMARLMGAPRDDSDNDLWEAIDETIRHSVLEPLSHQSSTVEKVYCEDLNQRSEQQQASKVVYRLVVVVRSTESPDALLPEDLLATLTGGSQYMSEREWMRARMSQQQDTIWSLKRKLDEWKAKAARTQE